MRLIEPVGVLRGRTARQAIQSAQAIALHGSDAAFALCRLIDHGPGPLILSNDIPDGWRLERERIGRPCGSAGLPARPLVMGILNATPDSFSDGGAYADVSSAVSAGRAMIEAGADIVDLGGESTRPGAATIDPPDEQARILPILAGLRGRGARIAIDTRNASTMRVALAEGADLINDISALSHDPASAALLAEAACPVVLSHMRGTPATMEGLADYQDVAVEVVRELSARVEYAMAAGIARERIIVDPGIGFAKTQAHNLDLLRRLPILANLGCRVLLGASRKRFIGGVAGVAVARARDPGSIAASLCGLVFPTCVLRVHDVPGMVQALRVWQAVQG